MRLACAALLLLLAGPGAAQQQDQQAQRLVLDASRALQAGNAARFLGYFDKRATPGFERFRDNALALTATKQIASSVEVKEVREEGAEMVVRVDWLLQLTPIDGFGGVEERRKTLELRVRAGEKAKIVALEPVEFFAPMID